MADPVYPKAWFQLHNDSWGTAIAGLKGTLLGTKQILIVYQNAQWWWSLPALETGGL